MGAEGQVGGQREGAAGRQPVPGKRGPGPPTTPRGQDFGEVQGRWRCPGRCPGHCPGGAGHGCSAALGSRVAQAHCGDSAGAQAPVTRHCPLCSRRGCREEAFPTGHRPPLGSRGSRAWVRPAPLGPNLAPSPGRPEPQSTGRGPGHPSEPRAPSAQARAGVLCWRASRLSLRSTSPSKTAPVGYLTVSRVRDPVLGPSVSARIPSPRGWPPPGAGCAGVRSLLPAAGGQGHRSPL